MELLLNVYPQGAEQPSHSAVMVDFDPLRDLEDKIFMTTLPNGDRVFITVTTTK